MNAIFVNADGSVETRPVRELRPRVADFARGVAWVHAGCASAVDGGPALQVYAQIPWSSYSDLSPDKERERQVELSKRGTSVVPVSAK